MHRTRRSLLVGAGVTVAAVGSAGCLGGSGDDGASGETLESLEVGGSPGGPVPIKPDGEVVLLDFWATWCAPCKAQMPELAEIRERFPGIHMLSVTNETDRDAIRSFWTEHDGTWPVAMDPEVRTNERFGVTRIPTKIVFDADGAEVWRHTGLSPAEDIAAALDETDA
jgi:thiol-disulfide isomerase/thioredoxin